VKAGANHELLVDVVVLNAGYQVAHLDGARLAVQVP
jgi:hypothetical protein